MNGCVVVKYKSLFYELEFNRRETFGVNRKIFSSITLRNMYNVLATKIHMAKYLGLFKYGNTNVMVFVLCLVKIVRFTKKHRKH